MNKIYDKLLLALAVLILLAAVGFYLVKSNALPSTQLQLGQPADFPYDVIPVRHAPEVVATWPEVTEQAPGELYDVFTPPKIYIDDDGTFKFTPPYGGDTEPKQPIGVYLAELRREPYRIQLEGYINDRSHAAMSLLLLSNEETGKQVRARVGDEKEDAEFKLLHFGIDRLRDADGNPYKVAKATLLDQRTGEEVVLTHGERLITDGVTVVLRSDEDSTVDIELKEVPAEFETASGECVLQSINLDESYVIVERNDYDLLEFETETLYLRKATEAAPAALDTATEAFPVEEEGSQFFDFAL
jgi:hypothetical protein